MQFSLTMMSQLLDWEFQNGFIFSMMTMEGFQEREYKKSLPETVTSLQNIPPSMMVKLDIILLLCFIVMLIQIVLVKTFE